MAYSMRIANEMGDVTLTWEESAAAAVKKMVENLMAKGVSFFIVTPQNGGLSPPKRTPLKNLRSLTKAKAISVSDDDFQALVDAGVSAVMKSVDVPVKTVRRAKSADEVTSQHSVAVAPRRGG